MGSDLDRLSVTITKAKLPKACCSCCSKHHESTVGANQVTTDGCEERHAREAAAKGKKSVL